MKTARDIHVGDVFDGRTVRRVSSPAGASVSDYVRVVFADDTEVRLYVDADVSGGLYCSQCGPGHALDDGLCERHGKPVRA